MERGWGWDGAIICSAARLWGRLTNAPASEPGGQPCCLPVWPKSLFWLSCTTGSRHRNCVTRTPRSLSVTSSGTHASVPEGAKSYSSPTKCRGHVSDGLRSSPQILALANPRSEVFLEAVVAPTGADRHRDTVDTDCPHIHVMLHPWQPSLPPHPSGRQEGGRMWFWKPEPLSASSGGQCGVWLSLLGTGGLWGPVQSPCSPVTAEATSWQGVLVPPCPHCLLC